MQKKLLSIGFLFLMAFNLFGYRLFLNYLQERQAHSFQAQIHQSLNEADLLTLKVPANLPYYFNSTDFEWIDGEVVIDGIVYQYVKRRIYNDSIEFQCLKNSGRTRLENAREAFFKLCNDLQANRSGNQKPSGSASVQLPLPEYCPLTEAFELAQHVALTTPAYAFYTARLTSAFHCSIEQPPESGMLL